MIQFLKNIWNAQRNAAAAETLQRMFAAQCSTIQSQKMEIRSKATQMRDAMKDRDAAIFDRNAYRCLTATLAAEYLQATEGQQIPDSIKEAHMLRGVATDWKYADDVKYGKGMFEKRQRAEVKRLEIESRARRAAAVFIPSAQYPIYPTPELPQFTPEQDSRGTLDKQSGNQCITVEPVDKPGDQNISQETMDRLMRGLQNSERQP